MLNLQFAFCYIYFHISFATHQQIAAYIFVEDPFGCLMATFSHPVVNQRAATLNFFAYLSVYANLRKTPNYATVLLLSRRHV